MKIPTGMEGDISTCVIAGTCVRYGFCGGVRREVLIVGMLQDSNLASSVTQGLVLQRPLRSKSF